MHSKKKMLVAVIHYGRNFELFDFKPNGIYVGRCTVEF
jgi:hypothetical protein